ncbi:MAG: phosphoribosylformylglycinamidine synthase subunit PurS [Acidimicrobiaceae bacterium]|nr:phosphoribosylformylglycinamidine synthase subunit PurS [Acidimicrobiaceae bacterium]
MRFQAKVQVWLRPGIADPQGHTVSEAINALGYSGVSGVRMGKVISFAVEADSKEIANEKVSEIASSLLSNPVLEDVIVEISED